MLLVQEQEKILYYAMGIRKKINKDIELFHNNYTSIPIDKNNICINCPNRIFHTGEHVKFGFGNPSSGNLFILPTFNNIKEIINILSKEYTEITGLDIFENIYITAKVKCTIDKNYNTYLQSMPYCKYFLKYETEKFIFRNILCLYINNNDYIANLPYHQIKIIFNNNQKGRYNNFKVLFANAISSFI